MRSPVRSTPTNLPSTLITFDIDGTLLRSVGEDANKMHSTFHPRLFLARLALSKGHALTHTLLHSFTPFLCFALSHCARPLFEDDAFTQALKEVCSLDGLSILDVAYHGSTDSLLLVELQEKNGISKAEALANLPALFAAMTRSAKSVGPEQALRGIEVLPGVPDLLQALQARPDTVVGLVTGNVPEIAWLKMEAAGLADLFSTPHFGGFGGRDFCGGLNTPAGKSADREQLVLIARAQAHRMHPGSITTHVHVGDAPADVVSGEKQSAGEEGGCGESSLSAFSLGVCTGNFKREELEGVSTQERSVVLDSMADTEACLRALGLPAL